MTFRLWFGMAFGTSPLLTWIQLVLNTVRALAPLVTLVGLKLVIDGLTSRDPSAIGAALIVGGLALSLVVPPVLNALESTVNDRGHLRIYRDLMAHVSRVPGVAHHENPSLADKVAYLRGQVSDMSYLSTGLVGAVVTALEVAATFGLLASVRPEFLLLPALGLLRIWSGSVAGRRQHEVRQRLARHGRMRGRLREIAAAPEHGVETRTSGLGRLLLTRFREVLAAERAETIRASRQGLLLEVAARLGFALGYGAAIAYTVVLVRNGSAPAGDIALIVLLAARVDQVAGMVNGQVQGMARTWRFFKAYGEFVTYVRESVAAGAGSPAPERVLGGITLNGVGFSYPQADAPALRDVDLHLPAGSTVALVGENGAGKTTLVKLLLRLYEPTAGTIRVDDVGMDSIDVGSWRERCSAGFQDFDRFEFVAATTVGVGDLPRLDDRGAVDRALERGDAEDVVAQLPDGLDTQLGSAWQGGVDLSVGQWQRLALARAFMRPEPLLLVLDEPTAALDPESEHALFERFAEATQRSAGGITVLVSHRFSTVRMADLIVVMHEGRLHELGSHDDLMAAGGLYAELYTLQAQAYR
ncbi:ABC transporter ATP-binding protein [Tenggerimyces flavus]|uniref:ABC transporter ATP-binding protein n=1 Tax=Tenggerimyces flavus TaxID=1708749 RepID=A0ABV7YE46_9ACTN|nr:ABC transporter ATP-binding protein [Tenggerimyces flavus]MBM7786060.1 ATP-binding cassette subfamily B protein [Tenggerimyces flavus]